MEHARTRTWAVPGPKQCRVLAVTSGWETSLSPLDMSVKNHVDVKNHSVIHLSLLMGSSLGLLRV